MITLIVLYFLAILIFSFFQTRKIENPLFNLFKAFFPSWKFFDESRVTPVLLYRTFEMNKFSDWIIYLPPKSIEHPCQYFFNPNGNYYLAVHSHIQQLLGDLTELPEDQMINFHNHLSYKITKNMISSLNLHNDFEFKISSIEKKENNHFEIIEDILISPLIKNEIPA